ncbi:hypothetical protein [Sphingomonas echinoides]|uniref:Uncharacterized protein n=1 Tax=Sphingomonas echinoides TaxID=59803 RepID=A0ABU4PKT4_9SPHN|nr:hypothetical protein [Sphingomonas echinoides]MDX5983693.1 hypothetical protein [Sphingomonas echinoides]
MTAYPGPIYGERIDQTMATKLLYPFRGVWAYADRLAQRPEGWFADDPDTDLVSSAEMRRAERDQIRFPGVRDILVVGHPVVSGLSADLAADRDRIPAPERDVVAGLSALDGFAFDGTIVTIDGVPVPAGKRQTDYFVVLRWRSLYSPFALPHLIYCRDSGEVRPADRAALGIAEGEDRDVIHLVDHDARHVTDETQLSLLMFSTATHRDNLVALQESNPALFVALWRRDMVTAWKLGRKMRKGDLPVSNPKSGIPSRLRRLMYGTALMSEFERLFEIIDCLQAAKGVTRDGVKAALLGCSSLTGVAAIETDAFIAEGAAHVRALHPTMNPASDEDGDRIATAFTNCAVFRSRYRGVRWVAGAMPVRYFLGVEPGMLAAVALIHMADNMKGLEGDYRQPGQHGLESDNRLGTATIELAVVITAGLCLPTARSILQRESKFGGSDDGWCRAIVPTLIDNPHLRDEVERLYERQHGLTRALPQLAESECDRKHRSSPYELAGDRAKRCARPIGEPGWTQGFRFEAWLRPDAELAFLRNCCRYVQYDPAQAVMRDACLAERFSRSPNAEDDALAECTDLPRQHPLERIQDLFRRFFDRLQVAELAADRASQHSRAYREAIIREVALLLAAVSPITVDPNLRERMLAPPGKDRQRLAVEALWNL